MASVKVNIASALKRARKNASMSVDQVGAAIGKSGKTISAWEVGRGQPDGDELIVLCKLLNAHLRDFYGEEYEEYIVDRKDSIEITDEERGLLEMYRKCNDAGKMGIEDFARAAAKQFPADGFTLNLDFIGEEDEAARSEKITRFYNDARAKGMTDEQLQELLDSLTSLISKANTGTLPKKNAVEVIYNSMMS